MKIKPLTKKQKEAEIASLKQLAENYKKQKKSRKREIIPFELDIGNFCCAQLRFAFEDRHYHFYIKCLVNKYYVSIEDDLKNRQNFCPFCFKHINEFFYIKQY